MKMGVIKVIKEYKAIHISTILKKDIHMDRVHIVKS